MTGFLSFGFTALSDFTGLQEAHDPALPGPRVADDQVVPGLQLRVEERVGGDGPVGDVGLGQVCALPEEPQAARDRGNQRDRDALAGRRPTASGPTARTSLLCSNLPALSIFINA